MMHTPQALYNALKENLDEIELQIKHIKNDIAREYKPEERDKINVWYWTYRTDGRPVLSELLCAKASVLSAMAGLQTGEAKLRRTVSGR